jgi:DNA polymerase elongation subunit (family B)
LAPKHHCVIHWGHTDGTILEGTIEDVQALLEELSSEIGVAIELDKVLRYAVVSHQKAWWFGVEEDGEIVLKGTAMKASNVPTFHKNVSQLCMAVLSEVMEPDEFPEAAEQVKELVAEAAFKLRQKQVKVEDLAFRVNLRLNPAKAGAGHQAYQVAKYLLAKGIDVKAGDQVEYVKLRKSKFGPSAKPLSEAKIQDIDTTSYLALLVDVLEPLCGPLDIELGSIVLGESVSVDSWASGA